MSRRTETAQTMNSEKFEYAIRKDVRNNPIVREVDHRRHREMVKATATGVFLVAVLLFWAFQHFELLRYGYSFEQMERERAVEIEINRHLQLELNTLRSPIRIERLAIEQLQMVSPGPGEASVIERVSPPAPPSNSVVARR
ncbi:MAG: cell division protein FtsL [Acidobacteria bacterium]|nr:cell division protein FtsL [Acidobacteriota bacterium]